MLFLNFWLIGYQSLYLILFFTISCLSLKTNRLKHRYNHPNQLAQQICDDLEHWYCCFLNVPFFFQLFNEGFLLRWINCKIIDQARYYSSFSMFPIYQYSFHFFYGESLCFGYSPLYLVSTYFHHKNYLLSPEQTIMD